MSTNTAIVIGVLMVGGALWHASQVNKQIAAASRRSSWEQVGGLVERAGRAIF